MRNRFCTRCGALREPEDRACGHCGKAFDADTTDEVDASDLPALASVETEVDPDAVLEELTAVSGIVGFDGLVDEILERLGRRTPVTPCLVGPAGSGRTTALRALQTRLTADIEALPSGADLVVRTRAEVMLGAGRGDALRRARGEADPGAVFAIDDLEVLTMLTAPAVDLDIRAVVRSILGRHDVLAIATLDARFRSRLETEEAELAGEMDFIPMPSLSPEDLELIGRTRSFDLSRFHRVSVPEPVVAAATAPVPSSDDAGHPAVMLQRLDRACVRARLAGRPSVEIDDLPLRDDAPRWTVVDPDHLAARLQATVRGQDDAVEAITRRLGLTSAGLDLRPHRPNGVFLLVGPTGVGKTALAKALARELFGSEERLIRLDMSEYSEEWSVPRLYGPHPGYKGSDEPEGWFTSRVLANPTSVVLLDEMEKAHPVVWNAFLQVFDDGRMTDSKGRTANFADTVILMTSNIGARAYSANPLGFGAEGMDEADAEADVRDAVTRTMPPELINRLDQIVVMEPLDLDVIEDIARIEVARSLEHLATRGWDLSLSDDVIGMLARTGFDPAYGARHLQRNIEAQLLEPLIAMEPQALHGDVDGERIRWSPPA